MHQEILAFAGPTRRSLIHIVSSITKKKCTTTLEIMHRFYIIHQPQEWQSYFCHYMTASQFSGKKLWF